MRQEENNNFMGNLMGKVKYVFLIPISLACGQLLKYALKDVAGVVDNFQSIKGDVTSIANDIMRKESDELRQVRKEYVDHVLSEKKDFRESVEIFKEIKIFFMEREDLEERVKESIKDRLKAIEARVKPKSMKLSIFQNASAESDRLKSQNASVESDRLERLKELEMKKIKLEKELQFFDDPNIDDLNTNDPNTKRFIPIPELPKGKLTTDIYKSTLRAAKERHNQRLEIEASYLEVCLELLNFPVQDFSKIDAMMEKNNIFLQTGPSI